MKLLTADEIAVLRDQAVSLITEVGLKVDHEAVQQLLLAAGCTLAPDGRVRFPASLVADFVALQEARRAEERTAAQLEASPVAAADTRPRLSGLMGGAFSPGPTRYYDYDTGQTLPVSTALAADMMRLAEATPEIFRVAPWFRQDIASAGKHRRASAVDDLVFALKLTRKTAGLDALNPAEVKYLAEISEIVTGRPGDSSYVGGSQCMTPPLNLGHRAAQEMLERRQHNVPRFYVATMAMVGASAPVDLPM
jgi:trimethylamine:corrinoid methyltransferase-like protein